MPRLLHDYVAQQASLRPDAEAIVMKHETIRYADLEATTNRLARLLQASGCQRGDRVCLLQPKSPTAIVSMLAVLKADCTYVPLDPASPPARLARIVDSVEPRCVLVNGAAGPMLRELTVREGKAPIAVGDLSPEGSEAADVTFAFRRADLDNFAAGALNYQNTEADPAHILFTSGSTGAPKGVVITHRNVRHFVAWANAYFGTQAGDRISGHPPLHFDLSTYDIYGTLAAGATLYPVPQDTSVLPNVLADFIRRARLTQWFSVPSALSYMAKFDVIRPDDFPEMTRLLWCGEVLPTPVLQYWMARLPHVTFTNLYGPTEATIASSYYTIPEPPRDATAAIPIGAPCGGEALVVLGDELAPVSPGEIGHLFIKGTGLSPGYWRDPQQTEAVFLPDSGGEAGARMYRTGDLARVGPDGLLYYIGRADSQIKSRGYRIELGEIETAVNAIPDVGEAAVVAIATDGFEGATICCAYVPAAGATLTQQALRQALSRTLPGYMLPGRWSLVSGGLPKNANGKIDRPKLREHFLQPEHDPDRLVAV